MATADGTALNKTMDRGDLDRPEAQNVIRELNDLVYELKAKGLRISSWHGHFAVTGDPRGYERTSRGYGYAPLEGAADDVNFPWFLYWEIAWIVMNTNFRPGDRVLDMGGSSSLFSYYLASRGLEVVTVELSRDLVENAEHVARRTGWNLRNLVMDMRRLDLSGMFDHITSVCVYEHLPLSGRIEASSRIAELLKPGGSFSITFDYANPSRLARISSPTALHEQFVRPSGLGVRGNAAFHDNGHRYLLHPFFHPRAWPAGWKRLGLRGRQFGLGDLVKLKWRNDYTFGALFLERGSGDGRSHRPG